MQGHNLGDAEWEESSIPYILEFLRTSNFRDPGKRRSLNNESGSDSSDSFVNVAPDDEVEDDADIELDFGDLAAETEISNEDINSWRSLFSFRSASSGSST